MSLEAFILVADDLVEFEAHLSDKQFPLDSIHSINVHKEELKSLWERVRPVYERCLADIREEAMGASQGGVQDEKDDEGSAGTLETIKDKYRNAYLTYCRCLTRLNHIADSLASGPCELKPNTPSGFRLPPCEVPTFNGDYAAWPTFRDMFTAVCIKNSRLSSVEKLFHLNQSTQGEANEIVKKVPLTNENFKVAWENLCSRYENRRVLINIQLKTLLNLSPITNESGSSIKKLQRDLNACISLLRLYDVDINSWDPIFVYICCNCLPESTLTIWEQSLSDKTVVPKWSDLDSYLTNRYRTLESVSEMKKSNSNTSGDRSTKTSYSKSNNNRSHPSRVKTFQNTVVQPKCNLCPGESHIIRQCPRFLKMSQDERWATIRKSNLCLNCFSKVHTVKNCQSKHSCFHCKKRHNTLLHKISDTAQKGNPNTNTSSAPTPLPENISSSIQSTTSAGSGVIQTCFASASGGVLLGTALVQICVNGLMYKARALIDSGSEGTFISERLFRSLKLPYKRTNAQVSGLNNTISASVQRECSLTLRSYVDDTFEISTSALVVPHLAGNLPSRTFDHLPFSDLKDLVLADPRFFECSNVDILIGGDVLPSIMLPGMKHNVLGSLMAQQTAFGWILTGPIGHNATSPSAKVVSYFCEISLDKEISRFWEVEDLPKHKIKSPSDQYCEDLYARTTKRDQQGSFVVSLPFKNGFPNEQRLGNSREAAMAQLFRIEKRFLHNPTLKTEYLRVLEEYQELGHMSQVDPPIDSQSHLYYYLPHHAVIKPDSTTTKLRVVFNASAATSNGLSLNDILHTGPVLQNDLVMLILRWRFFRFVFNGDITKMYRQIKVDPRHTSFQRILFRKSPNDPIQDYELNTVTFGVNCAPYLAIRTILQLADETQSIYPLASDILRHSMYVDDALAGAHTVHEAIQARNQLIVALRSGGFEMRKWTSNSRQIISDLPADHLLYEGFLELDDRSTAKTLGVRWDAISDCFCFTSKSFPEDCSYTKREVLSQISQLFDPAGWLTPCIVIAKIIMQKIWMDRTQWDEVITPESQSSWKRFKASYLSIESIRVPRWVNYSPECIIQFHGFCDASEKAYAAALFVRIELGDSVYTHLLTSKTRVSPIKTLSIPRLELCGAVLLAELIDSAIPQLRLENYTIYCWTDSTIVLSWLARPPCFWATFVANRVTKIIEVVDATKWFHVRSEDNPADLASRGVYPEDLVDNQLWWIGPNWLKNPSHLWPKSTDSDYEFVEVEKKPIKVHFSFFPKFDDVLNRFSCFPKAVRVICYVYRFYYNTHPRFRCSYNVNSLSISSFEVQMVQKNLILMTQKAHFPHEYLTLSAGKPLSSTSSIINLNPFLDSEGIIRSNGRLVASPILSYDERHPVILPYNCQFSRLYTRFVHQISLHGGNQLVLRLVRMKFWIPKIKNLIKTTIHNCKICIIYKRRCRTQIMAALPSERSEFTRPFTNTGLDFAGPFEIKNYAGRNCRTSKGYVCIFICFCTKAIHLEATSDLSTSAFLAAFSRFVSRRGCPLNLYSDNGTTFVGASKLLSKQFHETTHAALTSNYAQQNLTWHFIPPGAPHMGGLWEAGVKSFKSHFRKIAGHVKHTFEEFQTLLYRIEACLNSRPLSPLSSDPSYLSALTPGHFLIGSPLLAPIDPKIHDTPISISNRWERLKAIHQHLCSRWKEEYLKELHKRYKWQKPSENLQENMLVVIREENLPPNTWRLGRIIKVHPGNDGCIRVADIRTERGVITRPITKLVVLPSESSSQIALHKYLSNQAYTPQSQQNFKHNIPIISSHNAKKDVDQGMYSQMQVYLQTM
ncbi:uncharacterized protein LOC142224614 [Haematobia irritans]|uniref:uncharacterized protein LOC142224614 n=1 Tax=Haematobia irritans TaxID=7368 RepID=UPI003F4F9251